MNKEGVISYLNNIISFIERSGETIDIENIFPFFDPYLYQRMEKLESKIDQIYNCCSKNSDSIMKFLTTPSNRSEIFESFDQWLSDCHDLLICDPYLFHYSENGIYDNIDVYISSITNILPLNLKSLTVYHLRSSNIIVRDALKLYCENNNIEFKSITTNLIHDRVWIKNENYGRVVGTSFNGLGKKLAFILDLPDQDLHDFKCELSRI